MFHLPIAYTHTTETLDKAALQMRRAAQLISDPAKFTRGTLAREANGDPCSPQDPDASCFCTVGAIMRCATVPYEDFVAVEILDNMLASTLLSDPGPDMCVATVNDMTETLRADLVAMLTVGAFAAEWVVKQTRRAVRNKWIPEALIGVPAAFFCGMSREGMEFTAALSDHESGPHIQSPFGPRDTAVINAAVRWGMSLQDAGLYPLAVEMKRVGRNLAAWSDLTAWFCIRLAVLIDAATECEESRAELLS